MDDIEEQCNELTELLNCEQWTEDDNVKKIEEKIGEILSALEVRNSLDRKRAAQIIIEENTFDVFSEIVKYSVAICIFPNIKFVEEFSEKLLSYEQLTWQNLFFLYYQITHILFMQRGGKY